MSRWLALAVCVAACGDDHELPPVVTAVSGTRLALQKYRFDDGTEQTVGGELYDTDLHTRCSARTWADGVVRCVPVADEAVYLDDHCSRPVGRATMAKPSHFVAYDGSVPSRVFRAGAATDAPFQYFFKEAGTCIGPYPSPTDQQYFAVGDEIDGSSLLGVDDGETGDGRVGLELHLAADGLRVPAGLRDRDLDLPCTPVTRDDGSVACEPATAPLAAYFADPACTQPAIILGLEPPPPVAMVIDDAGCPTYHRIGRTISPPAYRRDGTTCSLQFVGLNQQVFAIDGPVDLPLLGRTLDKNQGRRLRPIVLDDAGGLRFVADRLYDTAIRGECERRAVGDTTRCLPADLANTFTLFTAGCAAAVHVAVLADHACRRPAFATQMIDTGLEIRAIGDAPGEPLFDLDGGICQAYPGVAGGEVRVLGPPIDPSTFEGSIYFGAR